MRKPILRLFMLAVMVVMCAALSAAEYILTVNRVSGTKNVFALSQNPVITFNGPKMSISSSIVTVTIPISDVTNYVISEETTGVEGVMADEGSASLEDGQVVFTQIGAGKNVNVVTPNGLSVLTVVADGQGRAIVGLNALPNGIYIVKSPKNSITVIKQ